jgi:hypothetical protein
MSTISVPRAGTIVVFWALASLSSLVMRHVYNIFHLIIYRLMKGFIPENDHFAVQLVLRTLPIVATITVIVNCVPWEEKSRHIFKNPFFCQIWKHFLVNNQYTPQAHTMSTVPKN